MLSLPWLWNHPIVEGWTCFTWIIFDQFVLVIKTQPTWLRENHWMSMLIIRGTAYLRKGNTYGSKYKFLIAMLNLCAIFMILLAALKKTVNTYLSNVSLMRMRSYLLMLKFFIITLMLKRLRSLLLLRVRMRLLLLLKS